MDKWVGKVYRNRKMKDVDFYVTGVTPIEVRGWWILRATQEIMGPSADSIKRYNIVLSDWKEVKGKK